jgi:hypothetical protein
MMGLVAVSVKNGLIVSFISFIIFSIIIIIIITM